MPDLARDRMERVVDVVRRALIAQQDVPFAANPLAQGRQHARLADAGLAREQRDLVLAFGGATPAVEQQRHLAVAPDKGRHGFRARRIEPADIFSFAHHQPGGDRDLETLQFARAQRDQFERPAEQPPRRFGDHHAAGFGQRLHPRRQIRCIADHRLLLRRPFSDQIADHHEAGGNPDARLQLVAGMGLRRADHRRDFQSRPHRPPGIVLMGAREAEIGQNAVAHEAGNEAIMVRDEVRAGVLIGAQDPPHILGIEPRRQRRRSREVAQHHGQLPPFGKRWPRQSRHRRCPRHIGQSCNRLENSPSRSERQAELFQIGFGQFRQNVRLDLALPKGRCILSKSKPA